MKSLNLNQSARKQNQITSSFPKIKKSNGLTPVRKSSRLNLLCSSKDETQFPNATDLKEEHDSEIVGSLGNKRDYESVRNARISENMERMKALGLLQAARDLNKLISSPKSNKISTGCTNNKPKWKDRKVELTPMRRSSRLEAIYSNKSGVKSPCTSDFEEKEIDFKEKNVFDPDRRARTARRCDSKGRGSIYDPILGICCHFCRQKKLCGEEDCKRCGDGDANQPCIGKTECSVCHSSNGIFCRACLKVRYGEEMEEVRGNKEWMCPHCIEERGVKPYWICNSSFCLKKRKLVPTGIAIYEARAKGYKSVAHLLADQLKQQAVQ